MTFKVRRSSSVDLTSILIVISANRDGRAGLLLNHANYANYIGTVSAALFRQPAAALSGRQLQFGVRYQF